MKRQTITRFSWMTFFGVLFIASVASAAPAAFDDRTIARKYNFTISGVGANDNAIEVVGWFEANASGVVPNVFSGNATIAITSTTGAGGGGVALSTTAQSFILVKDEVNGLYSTSLKFGDGLLRLNLDGSIVLDDTRGRSGKGAGTYLWASNFLTGRGIFRIEITAP
jgi:hypothetical protein